MTAASSHRDLAEPGMFEVRVAESFTASHGLVYANGQREDAHEHAWHVWVTIEGPSLDQQGLLVDFVDLRARLRSILAPLRGADLNTTPELRRRNPSAEHVALHIFEQLTPYVPAHVRLAAVEVEEEAGCFARVCAP